MASQTANWERDQGFTVFMMSWKNPTAADRELGMDDYLRKGVYAALDAVGAVVPDRDIHAVGYCIGGTLLSIAASTRMTSKPGVNCGRENCRPAP